MSFTPDEKIQKIAEAYSLDACDFLRDHFRVKLDWSDASIQEIEKAMDNFSRTAQSAKPTDEQVMGFAKMFGSYVGEVYRKNHGATWGMVEMSGQSFPGLKAELDGTLFWPWGRARNRLIKAQRTTCGIITASCPRSPAHQNHQKRAGNFGNDHVA